MGKKNKVLIAKVITWILNAVTTSALPILLVYLKLQDRHEKLLLLTILASLAHLFVFLVLAPFGKIGDFELRDRKQRPLFTSLQSLFYFAIYQYALYLGAPELFLRVLLVLLYLTVFFTIISSFWKISGHMTYYLYFLVSLVFIYEDPRYYWLLLTVPILGWTRVLLKNHTTMQVIIGSVASFLICYLLYIFV